MTGEAPLFKKCENGGIGAGTTTSFVETLEVYCVFLYSHIYYSHSDTC